MLAVVPVLVYVILDYVYEFNRLREKIDMSMEDGLDQVSECLRLLQNSKLGLFPTKF